MVQQRQSLYAIRDVRVMRRSARSTFELTIPTLSLARGDIVAVCAESGTGKSTLLEALALTLKPEQKGQFIFSPERDDFEILGLWRRGRLDALTRLRGACIGYVPQAGHLLPFLTVRQNIAFPARLFGSRIRDANKAAERLTDRLGISHCLERLPGALSIGEKQRAAVARALVVEPAVLLADEPTASIDPVNGDEIFRLLLELVRQYGMTTVVATHEWDRVKELNLPVLSHKLERADGRVISHFWT